MEILSLELHSMLELSCVQLFVIPWTVAHQAPLSMEFPRQEYWSGLLFPSQENLPSVVMETKWDIRGEL